MSHIRFYNARLITMEEPVCVLENMQLWVVGNEIAYIGDGTPKDRDLQYRVIAVRKNDN